MRVVALRSERDLAIGALVFRTREAHSGFVDRAAAFDAYGSGTFGCCVSCCSARVAHTEFAPRAEFRTVASVCSVRFRATVSANHAGRL